MNKTLLQTHIDLLNECRRQNKMLEKLIELNMNDLHEIADQRDWYFEEYQKMKYKNEDMNKNIPESFDKAVKNIEEGKTVPLDTALNEEPPTESETFKKICKEIQKLFDEKAKLEENLDRALKAWTEAVAERTEALLERDEYKLGYNRYEKLRRFSPMQFHELYEKNIKTGEHFDKLVDKL
jgi:DNA anti-recombination protein RmuC